MIIFISLILLFVLGLVLLYYDPECNTGPSGTVLASLSGTFIIICFISLIVNPIDVKANINKFLATKATIETARGTGVVIENIAIQHKIIEANQWLAKEQYYNTTMFKLWVPDEIDNLKPIR